MGSVCGRWLEYARKGEDEKVTHCEVPYSANEEYLQRQNPADEFHDGGLRVFHGVVHALPSSNELCGARCSLRSRTI